MTWRVAWSQLLGRRCPDRWTNPDTPDYPAGSARCVLDRHDRRTQHQAPLGFNVVWWST